MRDPSTSAQPHSRGLVFCYLLTLVLAACGLSIVWSAQGPAYVRIVELISFVTVAAVIAFAGSRHRNLGDLSFAERASLVVLISYVVVSAVFGGLDGEHRDVRIWAYDFQYMLLVPLAAMLACSKIDFNRIDRILAGAIAAFSVVYVLLIRYAADADVERSFFTISVLGLIGQFVGLAPILLLKYAPRFSWITAVGFGGALAQGYGAYVGAYRGGVILLGVVLVMAVVQSLFGGKSVSLLSRVGFIFGLLGLAVIALSYLGTRSAEFDNLMSRFSIWQSSGGGVGSDARFYEVEYYCRLSDYPQIFFGRGVGGHWYDYEGMYDYDTVSGGWRPLMHVNYMHYVMKIGVAGSAITLALISMAIWKRRKDVTVAFVLYATYLALLNMYYGPKSFNMVSLHMMLALMIPSYFSLPSGLTKAKPASSFRWGRDIPKARMGVPPSK